MKKTIRWIKRTGIVILTAACIFSLTGSKRAHGQILRLGAPAGRDDASDAAPPPRPSPERDDPDVPREVWRGIISSVYTSEVKKIKFTTRVGSGSNYQTKEYQLKENDAPLWVEILDPPIGVRPDGGEDTPEPVVEILIDRASLIRQYNWEGLMEEKSLLRLRGIAQEKMKLSDNLTFTGYARDALRRDGQIEWAEFNGTHLSLAPYKWGGRTVEEIIWDETVRANLKRSGLELSKTKAAVVSEDSWWGWWNVIGREHLLFTDGDQEYIMPLQDETVSMETFPGWKEEDGALPAWQMHQYELILVSEYFTRLLPYYERALAIREARG